MFRQHGSARLIPILLEHNLINAETDLLEDYFVYRGEEDA